MSVRPAEPEDVDALLRIENKCFTTDLITRRSFRRFLSRPTARVIVAELDGVAAGYGLLLIREGTALARLYSLAVDPDYRGQGIAQAVLERCESEAFDLDRFVLRLEVREDNAAARRIYERAGYRPCGRIEDYYEDGCAAIRMEKLLHGPSIAGGKAPYYAQTTEFTCGPACMLMAISHFDRSFEPSTLDELTLWREATTIYLASGHGGCGPFGLANAAARRGLKAEVRLMPDDLLFLASVRDPEKRSVMRMVQEGYRQEAAALGVNSGGAPLSARDLAREIEAGAVAVVLISGYRMFGKKEPHWLLVHDGDDRHLIVHDPWLEHERHESPADAANLPIPDEEFERMAKWGRTQVRAQVILRKE